MTDEEALKMRADLQKHYGHRVAPVNEYCDALNEYFHVTALKYIKFNHQEVFENLGNVDLLVHKSCLLDRVLYCGEKPSKTPCPVHKGHWSGIHIGWPDTFWTSIKDGTKRPVDVSLQCQKWYDEGCRCFKHACGCTTGWQVEND